MWSFLKWCVGAVVCGALIGASIIKVPTASATSFNSSNLISDGEFVNIDDMSKDEIQRFLVAQGGFLQNYSENSRSAAQIIYDASHGYGDATGSINGITIRCFL